MKTVLSVASLLLAPAFLAVAAQPELAPTNAVPQALPEVVVTGTRIPTVAEAAPTPMTVITREQIEQSQQQFVADVLRGEPGIAVARTGQPGSLTSVFLRGANSQQTLVLVDGIRVNNGFNNAYDLSQLAVDNIERIEVLRGPQSTLYGSEALGGVINIVTKQGTGAPGGSAQFEYGSFGTLLGRTSFAGRTGKASLAADFSYAQSDGDRINSDFSALNLSGRARYDFTETFSAALLLNYLKSDDGTPNDRFTDDPNDRTKNENVLIGLTLNADLATWWNAKATLSYARERGEFLQPAPNPPYFFGDYASDLLAERWLADFQNIFTPAEGHKILLGGTLERSSAVYSDTYGALDRVVDTHSAYAQYDFSPVERVTLTAGGRVDDNSAFGTHGTYRFGGRFTAPGTETIFRATAGTGFRAPSISQLYYPFFGNPNLQPEESFGWDAGFEQPLADGKFRLGATFFHNDFDNLITGFPPANVSRARAYGVENFATWAPLTNLTFRAAYTWQHTANRATGLTLDRRPEHSGSVSANWEFLPGVSVSAAARFTGPRSDMDYSGFPAARVELENYTKLDLALRWKVTKNFEVYGRAENLLGERYEEAYGFPSLGRFFSAGAIVRF